MCLCCIFLSLSWLSLCNLFFIYFLSCPIVINYIVKKKSSNENTIPELGNLEILVLLNEIMIMMK